MPSDPLHTKVGDFTRWSVLAFERNAAGDHADALNNMRKAAEAACKALLLHALPLVRAEAAINGAALHQLIGHVQQAANVPTEVVNHLIALRIHGNKGVHDVAEARSPAAIGVVHLAALAEWLFTTRLSLKMPRELVEAIGGKDVRQRMAEERRLQHEERNALDERIGGLQQRIDEIAAREAKESNERKSLERELATARQAAEEKDDFREELARIRLAVEEQRTQAPTHMPQAKVGPERGPKRPWLLFMAAAIGVIGVASWLLTREGGGTPAATTAWEAPPDSVLRVVLVPFTVVQDDPGIRLSFEEVLRSALRERADRLRMAVDLRVLEQAPPRALSTEEALALADSLHAGLLFHGELAEPTSTDSGAVTLRFFMHRMNSTEQGHYPPLPFRTLRERSSQLLLDGTASMMDRAMANLHARNGNWSRALALLYASEPVTNEDLWLRTTFRVQCHMQLGQYNEALRESRHLNTMAPGELQPYVMAAEALKALNRNVEAANVYETAVTLRPNDPELLLDFANALIAAGGDSTALLPRSVQLVHRALELDSTKARGWFYLGQAAYATQQWSEARRHFERAIALGITEPVASMNLAEILFLHTAKPDPRQAEALLMQLFSADSTEPRVSYLLGELYARSSLQDPVKAAVFYERTTRYAPQAERANKLGLATLEVRQGRPAAAVALLAPLWATDSSSRGIGNILSQALLAIGRHKEALAVASATLRLDPLDKLSHYNMGYIHCFGGAEVRDLPRAVGHFREALRTDPNDTLVLNFLGNALLEMDDLVHAEEYLLRGIKLAPDDEGMNRAMALLLDRSGRRSQAVPYYERTVRVRPDDALSLSNLAYLRLIEGPDKDINKALALAERSVRVDPSAPNRVVLAMALISHERYAEAAKEYRTALSERPDQAVPAIENTLRRRGF